MPYPYPQTIILDSDSGSGTTRKQIKSNSAWVIVNELICRYVVGMWLVRGRYVVSMWSVKVVGMWSVKAVGREGDVVGKNLQVLAPR